MSSTLKVQNFYYTNVTSESIPSSGAFTFNVAVAPTYTNGFLVISAENTIQREIVYFHSVSGNVISVRAENRALGGTTAKEHIQGESITMRDVAEIFNFYSDAVSTCFYTEKTGGLNVKVWGGLVYYNTVLTTVADTTLTLTDNATNYIKYDYTTNIISADTINVGNIKAIVVTLSGAIVSIVYNTAKETYTDFTVSLNTALPSQPGHAGEFLHTNGTNATWQPQAATPDASTTVKGVVEIATTAQVLAETDIGETGASLSVLPSVINRKLGANSGSDGTDGALSISSGTTTLAANASGYVEKFYSSINISGSATLAFSGGVGTGLVAIINCSGDFTMSGGTIDMNGKGGGGGVGGKGYLFLTEGNKPSTYFGGVGSNGPVSGVAFRYCGSGGANGGFGSIGGAGGGLLVIRVSGKVNIIAGTITANGADGSRVNGGGSGGGGGGSILIFGNVIQSNTGTITVNGGAGGAGASGGIGETGLGGGGGLSNGGDGSFAGAGPGIAGTSNSYGTGGAGGAGGGTSGGGGGGGAGFKYVGKFIL